MRIWHECTRVAVAACGFWVLLACVGCGPSTQPADLVVINGSEPESLDPALCTGQPDGRVATALFDGLTRCDPKTAEPIPSIAESWEISKDGRIYLFHLRANARWSNGEFITAEDFVYSWRRVVDPRSAAAYAGQLFYVKNGEAISGGRIQDLAQLGVQAVEPRLLRVELENPTPFFLSLCAFRTLAVVHRKTVETHGDRWLMVRPLPTSGCYTLEDWKMNDKVRLRKNKFHWDAANIQSEVVDLIHLESATTALNLFETRQADIIWDKSLIPMELIDVLKDRPYVHTFSYLATYFIRFNVTRGPFADARVRRAMAMAVDKQRIAGHIMKAGETPATSLVPPGTSNYNAPDGLPYDPPAARKLMADAGYPGGKGFPAFQYLSNTAKQHEQVAVELQQMWKKELGIEMELRNTEWKVYLADQNAVNYDISRSAWVGDYNDANTFLDAFMSQNANNRTGWKSRPYDEWLRQANQTLDVVERAELLKRAERLLTVEDAVVLPLFYYAGITFYRPDEISGIWNNVLDEHALYPVKRTRRDRTSH